jgi:uncharacterized membrane protein YraQ (UPF0718 family)
VALKKQGANKGATAAFLITTPESGVDSIAITYALLDPLMTVARPLVAFVTGIAAGIAENLIGYKEGDSPVSADLSCPVDGCCDGVDCPKEEHDRHHSFAEKIVAGLRYAFGELWDDLASWFLVGLVIAGLITAVIPGDLLTRYLGGGLLSMLVMLTFGIPLYICATASTPIAAALILKGVSPGAALVFLLAGPATNATSLTVLLGTLGKRTTAIYLTTICLSTVLFGLVLDKIYVSFGITAQAMVGRASEMIPPWCEWTGAVILVLMSVKPISCSISGWYRKKFRSRGNVGDGAGPCTNPS